METILEFKFNYAWGSGTMPEVADVKMTIRHSSSLFYFTINVHSGHELETDAQTYSSHSDALHYLYRYMSFFVDDFDAGVYND